MSSRAQYTTQTQGALSLEVPSCMSRGSLGQVCRASRIQGFDARDEVEAYCLSVTQCNGSNVEYLGDRVPAEEQSSTGKLIQVKSHLYFQECKSGLQKSLESS